MCKITELSLFIINQVRFRRFIKRISSRGLSELLGHSSSYVGMIESIATQDQYPPHEYPKLAEALSCSVHDLLPPDEMDQNSTGKLVDKVVLSLSNESDVKIVIEGLIAYGFFDSPKTFEEISKHLFIEKKEQIDPLFEVMEGIVRDGNLKQHVLEYYRAIV